MESALLLLVVISHHYHLIIIIAIITINILSLFVPVVRVDIFPLHFNVIFHNQHVK
jgi:hypothetical protein